MDEIKTISDMASPVVLIPLIILIVQYTKSMGFLSGLHTKTYVLILAAVFKIGLAALLNPTVEGFVLAVVNTFVIALACYSGYEMTFNRKKPTD